MLALYKNIIRKISNRPIVYDSIISLIGNGLGRIGGLAASIIIAVLYGADIYTDAFYMVFAVFTFFVTLIQGALDLAFIPLYAEVRNKNELDRDKFLSSIVLNLFFLTVGVTILINFFVWWILPFFLDARNETIRLITNLTWEISPALIGITISALFISVLNAEKWFFAAGLMPIIPSLGMIIFSYFLKDKWGIHALSTGLSVGALFQIMTTYLLLRKRSFKFKLVIYHYQLLNVLKKTSAPLVALFIFFMMPILDRIIIANYLSEGNITAFENALKLCQIPWSLATVGYINVFFSWWSHKSSEGDIAYLNASFKKLFFLSCVVYIPISLILFLGAQPLVQLAFGYGKYPSSAVASTSIVFGYFCLGYWAFMLRHTVIRFHSAQQNLSVMVKTALCDLLVHFLVAILLIKKMGIGSIGIAASIGYVTSLAYLFYHHLKISKIASSSINYVKIN